MQIISLGCSEGDWSVSSDNTFVDVTGHVEHTSRLARRVKDGVMRMRTLSLLPCCVVFAAALGCSGQPTTPSAASPGVTEVTASDTAVSPSRFGARTPGVVFVTSQGLYYDTFVVKDPLPMTGRFQLLDDGQTEFGPGQPGYLGGRWWEDLNDNGIQDPEDHYFLCPLLPPGRPTP